MQYITDKKVRSGSHSERIPDVAGLLELGYSVAKTLLRNGKFQYCVYASILCYI